MLNILQKREAGAASARQLPYAEATRRCYMMELSKYKDFQTVHEAAVNCLDVDPTENRYLLSGAGNGVIEIYDLHTTTVFPRWTYQTVCTVGLSNKFRHKFSVETVQWYTLDNGMFLSSGMDKLLKIWDTNTLRLADEYQFTSNVYHHHVSPIGGQHCLIAVATKSPKVKLVDLKSGSCSHILKGHERSVTCVRWSPREEFLLASGSADNRVLLWDVRSAKGCLRMLDQHNKDSSAEPNSVNTAHSGLVNGLCFTSSGLNLLSLGSDEYMRLWDVTSGRNTLVNYGKISNDSRKCLKFDASRGTNPELVFVPSDNHILVIDIFNGEVIRTLRGHYTQVNSVRYAGTEQQVFSCGNDRSILVWEPLSSNYTAYEDSLEEKTSSKSSRRDFTSRIGATADDWSSDED